MTNEEECLAQELWKLLDQKAIRTTGRTRIGEVYRMAIQLGPYSGYQHTWQQNTIYYGLCIDDQYISVGWFGEHNDGLGAYRWSFTVPTPEQMMKLRLYA